MKLEEKHLCRWRPTSKLSTRSIHSLLRTERTGDKANFLQHFYTEVTERTSSKQCEATRNYKLIQRYSFEAKTTTGEAGSWNLPYLWGEIWESTKLLLVCVLLPQWWYEDCRQICGGHDNCNITVRTLTYPSQSIKYMNIIIFLDI